MTPKPQVARKLLGQILKGMEVVREGQIQESLSEQRKNGGLIGQHLVAMGACTAGDVTLALGRQAGLETVDLAGFVPDPEVLELLDGSIAHTYGVLPLRREGGTLVVALGDPLNTALLEDVAFGTGLEVRGAIADPELLSAAVLAGYGEASSLGDAIADAARIAGDGDAGDAAQSAPIVRLLNSILYRAVRDRASDVHFETFPDELRIRYRVDGSLFSVESPPVHLSAPLIARIKVLSDLDIAETKMPQDGRIALAIDGRQVDLRVATLPGIAGESAVLRVLDRSAVGLELASLGVEDEEAATLRSLVDLPHGIVLVTGPTGSGKTTTLYALLAEASDESVKIITVEDPVEYDIDGIVQVPINDEIGVTYARVLRTVLRQDPDKILVGEIRDRDTAQVAVEASLTGHTVLATVHTNDAPSAVTRLVDMGIEPFLITATLEAVVAQRLVRRVCPDCRATFEPDEEMLRELGADAELLRGRTLSYGTGCESCYHTGYRGRLAIFEIMRMDDRLRRDILENRSTATLREHAAERGMRGLRAAGLDAVASGLTTVDEILRETMLN